MIIAAGRLTSTSHQPPFASWPFYVWALSGHLIHPFIRLSAWGLHLRHIETETETETETGTRKGGREKPLIPLFTLNHN